MKMGESHSLMKEKLLEIYSNSEAEIITDWTFEHFTGFSKMEIRFNKEKELTDAQNVQLSDALNKLLQHKPIQYVLGEAWFYGLKYLVNESVLIPRPETEELVQWAVSEIKSKDLELKINKIAQADNQTSNIKHQKILDIGTGSGCIPISLKKNLPNADISAIDVSEKALFMAKQNAINLNVDIKLIELDFLQESIWSKLDNYDIIISNPPYIPIKEKQILDKNITAWEPSLALFVADNDPFIFYKKIALFAKSHLNKNGIIFLEIHQNYAEQTKALFIEQGYKTELKKDINRNDRMIKASYEL